MLLLISYRTTFCSNINETEAHATNRPIMTESKFWLVPMYRFQQCISDSFEIGYVGQYFYIPQVQGDLEHLCIDLKLTTNYGVRKISQTKTHTAGAMEEITCGYRRRLVCVKLKKNILSLKTQHRPLISRCTDACSTAKYYRRFDVQGSVHRKWFQSITNKIQRYTVCLLL